MIRARIAVVVTLVGASLAGTSLLAQTAPEMKSILAGRKVEPPIKGQAQVASGQGALEKSLDPGAVDTVTIQTPWNAKMNGNSWQFSHANGTVKPRRVPKLDDAKAGAAAAKAPAKKK